MQQFNKEIVNGAVYTTTVHRGTEYSLCRHHVLNRWHVRSRRLSGSGFGSVKVFSTMDEVKAGCKAFAGVELLDAI